MLEFDALENALTTSKIIAFSVAPQLHDIAIWGPISLPNFDLPWHQLTQCNGRELYMHQCIEILIWAPNLEQCTFTDIYNDKEPHTFPLLSISLPRLSSIFITAMDYNMGCLRLFDYISETALTDVTIYEISDSFSVERFLGLSFRSSRPLQRLRMEEITVTEHQIFRCLRSVPSLVELILEMTLIPQDATDLVSERAPLKLAALKKLTISCKEISGISRLLDSLTIPAVKDIHFDVQGTEEAFPHSQFLALLSRSACTLRSLSFEEMRITDQELFRILQSTPSLVELKLDQIIPDDDSGALMNEIVRLLDRGLRGEDDRLLNLEALMFLGISQFDGEALVDMLSSRWHQDMTKGTVSTGVSRIRAVKIGSRQGIIKLSEDVIRRLRELKYDGIQVHISHSEGVLV